ncbi:hypothetical protein V8C34DRAFT_276922, partial [Trichoderma compactum]
MTLWLLASHLFPLRPNISRALLPCLGLFPPPHLRPPVSSLPCVSPLVLCRPLNSTPRLFMCVSPDPQTIKLCPCKAASPDGLYHPLSPLAPSPLPTLPTGQPASRWFLAQVYYL